MSLEFEIKRAIETGKVVLGSRQTIKLLANAKCKAVLYARDAPEMIKLDIQKLSRLSGIPAIEVPWDSKQLGIICGRPHVVAAMAIVDPGYSEILKEIEKLSENQ
jgi:large subunit ribosomal protein L30e